MKKILITGASGFIGSFLVEEALKRGFETWAGIRKSSSKRYLTDERIRFIEFDFARPDRLEEQLAAHGKEHGRFDYIIYAAGATKCFDEAEFDRVNHLQVRHFITTLHNLDMVPEQFAFISTLSIFGPIHEADYRPITAADRPAPNTAYGLSKLRAEQYMESLEGFPYVFYRPTGVYGPRETDYFLMAKSIRNHIDFSVGFKRQDLTFVYVQDVVQAVFLGIERGIRRRAYCLSDGKVYSSRRYSDLLQKELDVRFVLHVKCPLFVLKAVSLLAERIAARQGKPGTLNSDKYKIMKQRNWQCDITPAIEELGYAPGYGLERGVKASVAWYKKEGWL